MPVFLLFSLVALVDGLVQRDLRRWGGDGRVRLFTTMQKAALPLVVITWVVYLALPFSLHPSFHCVAVCGDVCAECGGDGEYVLRNTYDPPVCQASVPDIQEGLHRYISGLVQTFGCGY